MKRIDPDYLVPKLLQRRNDSHKGYYGHLLLVCGCQTMPGSAVLATGAALRSGCGIVTLHSTERALQAAVDNYPSAMLSEDPSDNFSRVPDNLDKYAAVAVGPGLGQERETYKALSSLLPAVKSKGLPMVLDADALNLIAAHPDLLEDIPTGSVMTPHLGELRRLLGTGREDPEDYAVQELSDKTRCIIVRKGFETTIFAPQSEPLVNTTGNPGMAKGGSGDVLTGLIGGLLARGYYTQTAAALGVWIHGYAGDSLTNDCTTEAFSSMDLIGRLHLGFKTLYDSCSSEG